MSAFHPFRTLAECLLPTRCGRCEEAKQPTVIALPAPTAVRTICRIAMPESFAHRSCNGCCTSSTLWERLGWQGADQVSGHRRAGLHGLRYGPGKVREHPVQHGRTELPHLSRSAPLDEGRCLAPAVYLASTASPNVSLPPITDSGA